MNEINGKIEFIFHHSDRDPKVTMTLSTESSLGEVIEAFETFLIASGYVFDGRLEITGNYVDSDLIDPNAEQN